MGYFYTGFDYKNRKNGYFKIGETGLRYLYQRLNTIQYTDCFQCLGYLILKNETKAERMFIESYARLQVERQTILEHTQNDHYLYRIEQGKKYEQAQGYADLILQFAMDACNLIGVEYEIGTKKMKRR